MNKPYIVCEKITGRAIITDRGRVGAQQYGLTVGGAMDEKSYLWANFLLGNSNNAAAIELAVGQMELRIQHCCTMALCGAERTVLLNGKLVPMWHSFSVRSGDVLKISWASMGVYSYLAVSGGFAVKPFFHSAACVLRENLGGHNEGNAIAAGDVLAVQKSTAEKSSFNKAVPFRFRPDFRTDELLLRVLPCYQFHLFSEDAINAFFSQTYQVSNRCDSMGYQLSGDVIRVPQQGIISEAISLGSVQITEAGLPIILMRDRQTIGGYPKIGTVFSVDIEKLAQCVAGKKVRFVLGDLNTAFNERIQREQFFN